MKNVLFLFLLFFITDFFTFAQNPFSQLQGSSIETPNDSSGVEINPNAGFEKVSNPGFKKIPNNGFGDSNEGFELDDYKSNFSDIGKLFSTTKNSEEVTWLDQLRIGARISLAHEYSYKTESPVKSINNRSSIGLEYSTYFATHFFISADFQSFLYWDGDHRNRAEEEVKKKRQMSLLNSKHVNYTCNAA